MILEFIESQQLEILLTPYEVAKMMNESGVWAFHWDRAAVIEDDEDDWHRLKKYIERSSGYPLERF